MAEVEIMIHVFGKKIEVLNKVICYFNWFLVGVTDIASKESVLKMGR